MGCSQALSVEFNFSMYGEPQCAKHESTHCSTCLGSGFRKQLIKVSSSCVSSCLVRTFSLTPFATRARLRSATSQPRSSNAASHSHHSNSLHSPLITSHSFTISSTMCTPSLACLPRRSVLVVSQSHRHSMPENLVYCNSPLACILHLCPVSVYLLVHQPLEIVPDGRLGRAQPLDRLGVGRPLA